MQGIDNGNKRNRSGIKNGHIMVYRRVKAHIKDVVLNLKNSGGLNKTYL